MATYYVSKQEMVKLLAEREGVTTFAPTEARHEGNISSAGTRTQQLAWLDCADSQPSLSALAQPRAAQSPKGLFLPAAELVARYGAGGVPAAAVQTGQVVLVGVRACELRARNYLDQVMLEGDFQDPAYRRRGESMTIVSCWPAPKACWPISRSSRLTMSVPAASVLRLALECSTSAFSARMVAWVEPNPPEPCRAATIHCTARLASALQKKTKGTSAPPLTAELLASLELVEPQETPRLVPDDPDDDKFPAAARAGSAGWIVTNDRHLLALDPYGAIRIVPSGRFVELAWGG